VRGFVMQVQEKLNINSYYLIVIVATLYFLSGKASLFFLHGNHIVNLGIFAAEGISLAFALVYGRGVAFGVFVGQVALALSNDLSFVSSFMIGLINATEVIIAISIFKILKLDIKLLSFRDIFYLFLLILFVLQPFSAIFGNTVLYLASELNTSYLESTFSWWFGNIMGQLLVTPLLILLFITYKKINILEFIFFGFIYAVYIYIFEIVIDVKNLLLLLSISLPLIIYIVSKKGRVYGMFLSFILSLISSYSVYVGAGVFNVENTIDNIINYNLFILVHITVVMLAGTLLDERKRTTEELSKTVSKEVYKNKEQQLLMLQQSRLAQMGEMISMIAHQWRQPLNTLSVLNQTILLKYKKDKLTEDVMKNFQQNSKKQITQMSETIDSFRDFFKPTKDEVSFSLNDVITHTIDMLSVIFRKERIDIEFNATENITMKSYPNEFGQALLNIINNAKDALIENQEGEKKIEIELKKTDTEIILEISDNAKGIPQEILEKIFDPYFSTKENKNGTGLGLYITKIVIEDNMKGKLNVSNTQKGAMFEMRFDL
jgi:signal transduction histidine kinase